jgi:hypothetical protein
MIFSGRRWLIGAPYAVGIGRRTGGSYRWSCKETTQKLEPAVADFLPSTPHRRGSTSCSFFTCLLARSVFDAAEECEEFSDLILQLEFIRSNGLMIWGRGPGFDAIAVG